ncbi:MAG TPA: hypothetical protein VK476_02870 [Flavobacterium sp.]|nr:hypothetical protein [Flavobacterium sp.]
MRLILTLTCIIAICCSSYSQSIKEGELKNQMHSQTYSYALITIENKGFGKKLSVEVDLGDTPEQIKTGREYSEILTNKKSNAAVLNYMAENQFELVESRENNMSYQGTGGTESVIFIMRKPK